MFALDDLYNNSQKINTKTSVASAPVKSNVQSSNFFTQFFSDFNVSFWVNELNQWLLAFTVFYSLWFLLDFIFWKVMFDEGSLENEEEGLKSLNKLFKLWYGYFVFLGIWSVAIFNGGLVKTIFEYLTLVTFVVVLVGVNLPMIPVIGKLFGADSKAGNIFSQIGGFLVSLLTQIWQGFVEVLGLNPPPPKTDKK